MAWTCISQIFSPSTLYFPRPFGSREIQGLGWKYQGNTGSSHVITYKHANTNAEHKLSINTNTYRLLHGLNLYIPDIFTWDRVFHETWRVEGNTGWRVKISGKYRFKPCYNIFIPCLPAILLKKKLLNAQNQNV